MVRIFFHVLCFLIRRNVCKGLTSCVFGLFVCLTFRDVIDGRRSGCMDEFQLSACLDQLYPS